MTTLSAPALPIPEEELEAVGADGVPVELTVTFTDLQDFTTYTEVEGDEAASRMLTRHHRESLGIVRGRGGSVIKRLGDGLMLTFPSPESAVLACLELGEQAPLPLRAGIHCGIALVTDDDVIGRVVNLAARVTAFADGGEVVVTDDVRRAVGGMRGVTFRGPYSRSFKGTGMPVPVHVLSRQHDG